MLLLLACVSPDDAPSPRSEDTSGTPTPDVEDLVSALPTRSCETPEDRVVLPYRAMDEDPGLRAQDSLEYQGHAIAVGDLDGDGARDLVLSHGSGAQILMQDPVTFSFREETFARLPEILPTRMVALEDLDEDGFLDIVLAVSDGAYRVFANDGTGHFQPQEVTGFPGGVLKPRSIALGDLDGDGDLDALLAHDGTGEADPRDALLLRTGTWSWEDATERLPAEAAAADSKGAVLVDMDGDRDLDAYIYNHLPADGGGNTLLRNDGQAQFTPDPEAGLDLLMSAMGLGVAELNGDALPDFLISDAGDPQFLLSSPDGWYSAATAMGITRDPPELQIEGWGTALEDLDHDGDVDAWMVFGQSTGEDVDLPTPPDQPDAVWLQEDGQFHAVAPAWGVDDIASGRSLAVVDLDGDGFLDVVTAPNSAPARVWHATCDTSAWVTLSVLGPPGNRAGVGARVELEAGGRRQTRWLLAGGTGHMTSVPVEAHFGLGELERVDWVWVHMPDGRTVEVQDLAARQRWRIDAR